MPIGIIVFIVFMIIILQVLSALSKRTGRSGNFPSSGNGDRREEGKKRACSLFGSLWNPGLNSNWMRAAGDHSLTFIRPDDAHGMYPGISGKKGDLLVIAGIDEGDSDSPPFTYVEIRYREALPIDFLLLLDEKKILEEFITGKFMAGKLRLNKLAGLLAASKDNFLLVGSDSSALEAYFSVSKRNMLEKLMDFSESLRINPEGIFCRISGVIGDGEYLSSFLELAISAGNVFSQCPQSFSPQPSSSAPSPAVSPVFAPPKEEKPLMIPPSHPAPNLLKEEKKIMEKIPVPTEEKPPAPAVEAPPAPAVEEVPAPAMAVAPAPEFPPEENSLHLLAEELFTVSFPDAALKKKWEEKKGILMKGEGIIQSSYDYRSDFVFGQTPGVKVTIDLGKIQPKSGSMALPYRAVISFPETEKDFFRANRGKKIAFSGNLLKCETFAKEICLTNGMIFQLEEK